MPRPLSAPVIDLLAPIGLGVPILPVIASRPTAEHLQLTSASRRRASPDVRPFRGPSSQLVDILRPPGQQIGTRCSRCADNSHLSSGSGLGPPARPMTHSCCPLIHHSGCR